MTYNEKTKQLEGEVEKFQFTNNSTTEGVIVIKDKDGEVTTFIRHDLENRQPTFYKATKMGFSDLEEFFK